MLRSLTIAVLWAASWSCSAEVLVLVHGYLGSDRSWHKSGVVEVLQERGFSYAASYMYSADGVRVARIDEPGERPFYTLNLPSNAPVIVQAGWLSSYLEHIIAENPKQAITLAGHSAGGVVARYLTVTKPQLPIDRLITIAAPHLGTGRAIQGLDATSHGGWLGSMHKWLVRREIGDQAYQLLRQSRGILRDLQPEQPGNFLYWLNRQTHPTLEYISVIRTGTVRMPGDWIVPPYSQDLRLVKALGQRAQSYRMAQGHTLTRQDGQLLANLMDGIRAAAEENATSQ